MIDDEASRIADQRSEEPSSTMEQRSEEASGDGHDGVGALLGLELTTVEKSGQNPAKDEDSQQCTAQSPLLGTNSLKSLSKSSNRRSTQRVCNDLLLRFGSSVEARRSQNSAENRARGCYGFTPENLPKGMCIRGGQFYYRRNVPKDAQGLIGRNWKSAMMKMKNLLMATAGLTLTAPSIAQDIPPNAQQMRVISSPAIGAENTVPAGGEVYSFIRLFTIEGAKIDADTKAGHWLMEQRLPAGTQLVPVETTKAFKACVPAPDTFTPVGPCFIDDTGDGTFDRHSGDEVTMFRKLKPPVSYSKASISVAREDSFKQVILYQGATADSLRFSYREFKNDMARPAFTEELTIPREAFPAMIMVKNLQIEVLGVSGMGFRYRMVKVL